jgi:hypothetical protein
MTGYIPAKGIDRFITGIAWIKGYVVAATIDAVQMRDDHQHKGNARMTRSPPFTAELVAAARASDQTVFDNSDRLPDDDGVVFATAVPDAPLQVLGRLSSNGRWYITGVIVEPLDQAADNTKTVTHDVPGMIVLCDEPVADAMIRFELSKMMGAILAGNAAVDAADALLARLALPCNARFRSTDSAQH